MATMVSMDILQQTMFALEEQNSQNMMKLQQANLEAALGHDSDAETVTTGHG